MLYNIIAVFIGSGLGGVCRYLLSTGIDRRVEGPLFPWGTLAVNVFGCLLIGVLYGVGVRGGLTNSRLMLAATMGFCGGFTTFSTLIKDGAMLMGQSSAAGLLLTGIYLVASIFFGFAAFYAGLAIVKSV